MLASMKALPIKLFLVFITLAAIIVLGVAGWWLYRVATRPSMARNGGTVLVYEIDIDTFPDSRLPDGYQPDEMAEAVKRRLDSTDSLGVAVRPVDPNRLEISIPRAGNHTERIEEVKSLLLQIGHLEFRILANIEDDREAIAAARSYIGAQSDLNLSEEERAKRKNELELLAERGKPPPVPPGPVEGNYETRQGKFRYSWVEVDRSERKSLGLDNVSERTGQLWEQVAAARARGEAFVLADHGQTLVYSRPCTSMQLSPEDRKTKGYDYFLLTRENEPGKEVTSAFLKDVSSYKDRTQQPAVNFRFNKEGGSRFYDLTSANVPTGGEGNRFFRLLAILLDGQIMSAPRLNEAIRDSGQITGNFTEKQVDSLVSILRAGALPAPLKPLPVSESTVEPKK